MEHGAGREAHAAASAWRDCGSGHQLRAPGAPGQIVPANERRLRSACELCDEATQTRRADACRADSDVTRGPAPAKLENQKRIRVNGRCVQANLDSPPSIPRAVDSECPSPDGHKRGRSGTRTPLRRRPQSWTVPFASCTPSDAYRVMLAHYRVSLDVRKTAMCSGRPEDGNVFCVLYRKTAMCSAVSTSPVGPSPLCRPRHPKRGRGVQLGRFNFRLGVVAIH